MKNKSERRPFMIWLLISLLVLLAFGALLGGGAFILAPDGHLIRMPLSNLANSPFSDFFIPGVLLFVFIGLYPSAVAFSLWKRPAWRWPDAINPFKQFHWSWAAALAVGVILIIWIITEVQFMEIGLLHVMYFVWAALIVLVTLLPNVREYYRLKTYSNRKGEKK